MALTTEATKPSLWETTRIRPVPPLVAREIGGGQHFESYPNARLGSQRGDYILGYGLDTKLVPTVDETFTRWRACR